MGVLDGPINLQAASKFYPSMPGSLGWDTTHFPLSITSISDIIGSPRSVAAVSVTPEGLFDAVSTARSAPGATYYVDVSTGNDANAGTSGSKFKSIWKAIVAANAAAVPTKIIVTAGTYFRTNGPWYNGGSGTTPTVDIAFIADGGRVITGTFDPPGTPSRDATYVNTYSYAVASVNRVCDMANLNRFGNYNELTNVSTAALCNVVPDSWSLVAGTLYINRRDQQAVTNNNTRVYRPSTKCFFFTNAVSAYLGGTTPGDGFDCEGGSDTGVLHYATSTPGTTRHVVAVRDSAFRYGGGITDTGTRGVSVDSLYGLAAFFNCRADANQTDGFNFHNTYTAGNVNALTVNCTGHDNGRAGQVSNNGWTSHEDYKGIDVAGYYSGNRGGTMRSINTSKSWLVGTAVENDMGDKHTASGAVNPTAVRVDDTAVYWCDRVRINMPAGTYGYYAASGATIHKRNCWPVAMPDVGTVDSY